MASQLRTGVVLQFAARMEAHGSGRLLRPGAGDLSGPHEQVRSEDLDLGRDAPRSPVVDALGSPGVLVVAQKLGHPRRAAEVVDELAVGLHKTGLNTAFTDLSTPRDSTPGLFFADSRDMHSSVLRLLDFAKEVTANSRDPVTSFATLGRRMGVSSAVMSNWKARGISKEGALTAEGMFGCSATWVLEGKGAAATAGQARTSPPSPPADFSDRHEVSDSDWAALTAFKTLFTHDEIEEMKSRAMSKLQETAAMLQAEQMRAYRKSGSPPPAAPDREKLILTNDAHHARKRRL